MLIAKNLHIVIVKQIFIIGECDKNKSSARISTVFFKDRTKTI